MGRGCRATDYGRSSAEVAFQTKPQLALEMIEAALDAGVPAKWMAGDEVYGSDGQLRRALEARDQAYVLAVKSSEHSTTWPPYGPPGHVTAATVAAAAEPDQWQRLRCDEGAQGERWYDWLCGRYGPRCARGGCTHCWSAAIPSGPTSAPSTGAIARPTPPLEDVVRAVGSRWTIEEVFELATGQVGLDQYEVHSWRGWHRHATLALLALAVLAVSAAKRGHRGG